MEIGLSVSPTKPWRTAGGPFSGHATLANNLVSYWPLSADGTDSVGSNDLTNNNAVTFVPLGPSGVVAQFTQANDEFLSSAYSPGANATYTTIAWHRPSATGIGGTEDVITGGSGDYILGTSGTVPQLYTSGFGVLNQRAGTVVGNQWGMIAGYYEHGVGSGLSYNASVWQTFADVATGTWTGTFIGARDGTPTDTTEVDGNIGRVGIWSRVLSDAEITSLYNSGNGKSYADLTDDEKVGLVSYWNLDEVSGTRADSHGSNTLTDNNTVTSVTNSYPANMLATVANFVAADSQSFSRAAFTLGAGDYTYAVWVYATSGSTYYSWGSIGTGSWSGASSELGGHLSGANMVNHIGYNGGGSNGSASKSNPGQDAWFLFITSYDSVDNSLSFHIDDVAGTPLTSADDRYNNAASVLRIGSLQDLGGSFWNGKMSSPMVWSRVLTAQERTDLYNAGAGLFY